MTKPDWPKYAVGASRDHIYAIGVLIANWNDLERQIIWLLWELLDSPRSAESLTSALHNSERFELTKALAFDKIEDEQDRDLINQCVSFASICNGNRNIIAHASYSTVEYEKEMFASKRKSGKGTERSHYKFSLDQLRMSADECIDVYRLINRTRRWLKSEPTKDKNVRKFTMKNQLALAAKRDKPHTLEVKRPELPAKPATLAPLPPRGRASR